MMGKPKTKEYAARKFLQDYVKENRIKDICELFDKEILIESTYDIDWNWSIEDEMFINGCSEKEAIEKTKTWFNSMSNEELFYRRISSWNQNYLIVYKAEELGFEWKE